MTLGTRLNELRNTEETSNAGIRWSIDELEKLSKEIVNNKSYEEIALEHKRTVSSIISRVISHIIYPKYKDNIDIDIEKISVEYNIDIELIKKNIKKIVKNDSLKNDSLKNDVLKNDVLKNDSLKNDSLKNDVLKNDVLKNDVLKNDVLKNDSLKNDDFKNDGFKNDVLKNDVLKNDVLKNDSLKNESKRILEYLLLLDNKMDEINIKLNKLLNNEQK